MSTIDANRGRWRTYRSTDEAFRTPRYACAIQQYPRLTLWRRFVRFFFCTPWRFEE